MQRKFISSVLGALLFLIAAPAAAEDVPLEDLLREVKQALLDVSRSPEARDLPPLKSAKLNVSTVQKRGGGAKFKLWVIEFGKKKSSELVTTVNITMSPPPANTSSSVSSLDLSDTLTDAMLSAARAINAVKGDNPPLLTSEVKATLKFGVSRTASGSLKIEFLPVTLSGSGEFTRSDIQEIALTYSR